MNPNISKKLPKNKDAVLFYFFDNKTAPFFALYVAFAGIAILIITKLLASKYNAELYQGTLPTISKAAAYDVSAIFFEVGMTSVAMCSVLVWVLFYKINKQRIKVFVINDAQSKWYSNFLIATISMGFVASLSLGSLSIVSLNDHNDFHMRASELFFSSQMIAFIMDTWLIYKLNHFGKMKTHTDPLDNFNVKLALTLLTVSFCLFFLFMFITKEDGLIDNYLLVRQLYVYSEFITACLCLTYPLTYYYSIKSFFDE